MLLLLTHSPGGVALATPLVRVAGVALRHVAALVAAALGPRRCHPRRPAALIHIAAALVAPLLPLSPPPSSLDASTPPPSTPPPSRPRRRRPRRRRPRRRRPHCSPAYTTLWLCVHCDDYCERCDYRTVCVRAGPILGHPCFCMHVLERVVERVTV